MSAIEQLQQWLKDHRLQGLLIPSTDEFLSEWTVPAFQRLRWATGFSGSVGLAVVLEEKAVLFVDGRYTLQAEAQTAGLALEIRPLNGAAREQWLNAELKPGDRLTFDPALHAWLEVEKLRDWSGKSQVTLVMLAGHPIDELWGADRPSGPSAPIEDHPLCYAGQSSADKCAAVCRTLTEQGLQAYLIADPQDLAWLLNIRSFEGSFVPVSLSYGLLEANGRLTWFVDATRLTDAVAARLGSDVSIVPPAQLERTLTQRVRGKIIGADFRRTPCKLAQWLIAVGQIRDDSCIERRRWKKHPAEITGARRAHHLDGRAVIRFWAWLERTLPKQRVTEQNAADQLLIYRQESPEYRQASMPAMSASGPSSAWPHYAPGEEGNRNRVLNEHTIYWMDSGGQYSCGTTDNTVAMALGEPQPRHKMAHTLVLKGFIALARARFPAGTLASQLDSFARQHLWQHGMDYAHGTSHGVGSLMNIHEGPVIGKYHIHTPLNGSIEAGMILSNEPAYYAPGDFGVRIESHILAVASDFEGFLEFETLSRLPIDPRLVERSMLTEEERRWLSDYHHQIRQDYAGELDETTARWLNAKVDFFIRD